MLTLQNGKIIYNNSEILGNVEDMNFIEGGFIIALPDGSTVFIPEQDCTASESKVFEAYHEYYKNTGGVKPVPEMPPQFVLEPVDEEKAAMAEAIIDMSQQINELRSQIKILKGGI
jgi:predicted AlkP superfamily pyrophosphatase or phosphodiesterase